MSDPFESDLSNLAPHIDIDGAFDSFDASRRRRRRRRRAAGGGLGAVAAVVAGIAFFSIGGGNPVDDVTAGPDIRFGPSLTGTARDVRDQELDILTCVAAVNGGINTIVFLEPEISADTGDESPLAAIGEIVRSIHPEAVFVSQQEMHAEALAFASPDVGVSAPSMFPASFRLTREPDDNRLLPALADLEGVLQYRSTIPAEPRLCDSWPSGQPPLTSTEQDLEDRPAIDRPFDSTGLADLPPPGITPVLGGVVSVVPVRGGSLVLVAEFAPDTDWEYFDAATGVMRESSGELEDPRPVTVTAVGDVVYRHCDPPEPLSDPTIAGARIEATPAGPLAPTALGSLGGGTLGALAWVTISCVDVDLARDLWADAAIDLYTQHFEGVFDGQGVGPLVQVSGGSVVSGIGFDTESLFDRIDAALQAGNAVRAEFNPDLGYLTRLVVTDAGDTVVDLVSRSFNSADRETACPSTPDGPLDLSAEPVGWALDGDLTRWYDPDGCPVRLDVITHYWGPSHCSMERAEFIEIRTPIGSTDGARRLYVSDPDGTLDRIREDWPAIREAQIDLVITSEGATGYTSDRGEIWTTAGDVAIVIQGAQRGQTFYRVPVDMFVCF